MGMPMMPFDYTWRTCVGLLVPSGFMAWLVVLNIRCTLYSSPESVPEIDAIPEDARGPLLSNVKRRMQASAVKVRADIDITCFQYDGIDAIKEALRTGLALSTEKMPIAVWDIWFRVRVCFSQGHLLTRLVWSGRRSIWWRHLPLCSPP